MTDYSKYVQEGYDKKEIKIIDENVENMNNTEDNWLYLDNGSRYNGELKDSKPNGEGVEVSDYYKYKGEFLNGKWNGKGTLILSTTKVKVIEAEFVNGCICGI